MSKALNPNIYVRNLTDRERADKGYTLEMRGCLTLAEAEAQRDYWQQQAKENPKGLGKKLTRHFGQEVERLKVLPTEEEEGKGQ